MFQHGVTAVAKAGSHQGWLTADCSRPWWASSSCPSSLLLGWCLLLLPTLGAVTVLGPVAAWPVPLGRLAVAAVLHGPHTHDLQVPAGGCVDNMLCHGRYSTSQAQPIGRQA